MGPRFLQSQIHSDYSTGSGAWVSYRTGIQSMYEEISSKVDFNDHLIREYNRKIDRLNQPIDLFFAPYDAGFRFIGSSISTNLTSRAFDIDGNVLFEESSDVIPNDWTSTNSKAVVSVILKGSLKTIGSSAFNGCTSLTSITIPASVTRIEIAAFNGCSGLTSITIPNSVTSIGFSAFSGCSGLTSITIPNSVTSIGFSAFYGCSGLTSITIPNSVKTIGAGVFGNCTNLTSITVGSGVTSIGSSAFASSTNLSIIHFLALTAPTLGSDVFSSTGSAPIHVPVGATGYGATFGGRTVIYDL
jgi:hypothetical protein